MPKYLQLKPHLSSEELEAGYRKSKTGIERSHYQVIWLLSQGKRSQEVAEVTGYHVERVRQLVRRYNTQGPAGLGDQRQHNAGGEALLSEQQEADLKAEVEQAFADGQPYTGVQVAKRMSEILGRPVRRQRGWELLKRWKHALKVPRRRHVKFDDQAAELFKKR
jgi:transposase